MNTDRLTARTLVEKELEAFYALALKQKTEDCGFLVRHSDSYYTRTETLQRLASNRSDLQAGKLMPLGFFSKDTNELVFTLNFSAIIWGPFRSCYAGWYCRNDVRHTGLGKEALSLGIDIAFKGLGLHRIEANIIPTNIPSKRLAMSMGFSYEGTSKDYLFIDGNWRDHGHYVLINRQLKDMNVYYEPDLMECCRKLGLLTD
ncbi:MAG: GNAT family N-acetyltransferase [Spirochaetia bacterium]|nr:GNAT family N-acetyltransferase [Spirochaetia bacterium]